MNNTTFNVEKYVALAYGQPKGLKLQQMVEDHWREWCIQVNMAPWRPYWRKCPAYTQPAFSPKDKPFGVWGCGNIPLVIYTAAVWGFGVDDWLKIQEGVAKSLGRRDHTPIAESYRLRRVVSSCDRRQYIWDEDLHKRCGVLIPIEFGTLDRWLEPMWQQICAEAQLSHARNSAK